MKEQLDTLGRLASLRATRVQQMLGRVTYQQSLCQRYRNNITGLTRLCGFTVPMTSLSPLLNGARSQEGLGEIKKFTEGFKLLRGAVALRQ